MILKSGWSISYVSWELGSGREDVGQQEVPWDSRDTALGVPGDVPKARREGREFGELGRAKCKACEVIEKWSKPNLKSEAKQLVTSSTGIKSSVL